MKTKMFRVDSFKFQPGKILARKYEVVDRLGAGWEGEVYLLKERNTGIERAAKFFFPQRNINNRAVIFFAKKLHKLRHCSIITPYHSQETIIYYKKPVTFLVSDYVEGEILGDFLKRQRGKRISSFHGIHLLYALAKGFDEIHRLNEYHGDLHSDNIIVQRYGLGFELKLLDLFHWNAPKRQNIQDDICDMIRIFYDAIGGQEHYHRHPKEVKAICCGLKKTLILKKFRTSGALMNHLKTMEWN